MFHLIAGILCLFGFNLPATNFWYFLASSFTDMWHFADHGHARLADAIADRLVPLRLAESAGRAGAAEAAEAGGDGGVGG